VAEEPFPKPEFWQNWMNTQIGCLKNLSTKKVAYYYDYFASQHYGLNPEIERVKNVAAADRMIALQSELQHRRTRNVQVFLGILAAIVLIGVGVFQHNRPCNENASIEHPRTQILPAQPASSSQPSP